MAARSARAIAEEQRRLLGVIEGAYGPALNRDFFALIDKLFERMFGSVSRFAIVQPSLIDTMQKLLDRESSSTLDALEGIVLTKAHAAGIDSLWAFVKSAMETPGPHSIDLWSSQFPGVNAMVDRRMARTRSLVRRPLTRVIELLFIALLLEIRKSAARGLTFGQLHAAFERRATDELWRVVRISRTTDAWMFNGVRMDLTLEQSGGIFYLRWTELVDDATGEPLDARVAEDSIVLHGQVALPGGEFTMPPDPRVRQSEWNRTWIHPPNRPNDRSVLTLWWPGLDVPAWVWKDGARVPLA